MVWVAELRAPNSTSCWKFFDGAQTESTGFGDSSTMLGFGWRVLTQSCWCAIVSSFVILGFIHHASSFLLVSLLISYLAFMGTQCFHFLTWTITRMNTVLWQLCVRGLGTRFSKSDQSCTWCATLGILTTTAWVWGGYPSSVKPC